MTSTLDATPQPKPVAQDADRHCPAFEGGLQKPAWSLYICEQRHRLGVTGAEVARRMGLTAQTYAGFESGIRTRNGVKTLITPRDETLHRVAKALNLTSAERCHLFTLAHAAEWQRPAWQTQLRSVRVAASVSEQDAAYAAGVTVSTYREWERRHTGAPKHDLIKNLLAHLGLSTPQVAEFMELVPSDAAPVRAPSQPKKPVSTLPRWSQEITRKRLELGLYLAEVDLLIGQQSIVRRFELGGWERADGRLSVPSCVWIDRIADALSMTRTERANLHFLADHERVSVATSGRKPLVAELFHEVRKALDITCAEANRRIGLPERTWSRIEAAHPETLDSLDPATVESVLHLLPVGDILATALRAVVPEPKKHADNNP
jgi:transcriptional regulator with XRE-family HTH domain